MWYHKMYHLVSKESIIISPLELLFSKQTLERRIATARTLDVLNFTANALHQENIAKIAIAMVAAITMRTNRLGRRL